MQLLLVERGGIQFGRFESACTTDPEALTSGSFERKEASERMVFLATKQGKAFYLQPLGNREATV